LHLVRTGLGLGSYSIWTKFNCWKTSGSYGAADYIVANRCMISLGTHTRTRTLHSTWTPAHHGVLTRVRAGMLLIPKQSGRLRARACPTANGSVDATVNTNWCTAEPRKASLASWPSHGVYSSSAHPNARASRRARRRPRGPATCPRLCDCTVVLNFASYILYRGVQLCSSCAWTRGQRAFEDDGGKANHRRDAHLARAGGWSKHMRRARNEL